MQILGIGLIQSVTVVFDLMFLRILNVCRLILSAISISSLAACSVVGSSWLPFGDQATPETKMAVIRIASEYLENIIVARESELGSMVLWNDYLENNKGIASKDAYYQQVRSIYNRFPPDRHPFVGLDVIDASVRGNTAYLKFQKFKQPDSPIISIKLYWIGGGWLIVDDSLFGKEGLIAELSQSLRAAT